MAYIDPIQVYAVIASDMVLHRKLQGGTGGAGEGCMQVGMLTSQPFRVHVYNLIVTDPPQARENLTKGSRSIASGGSYRARGGCRIGQRFLLLK